MGPFDRFDDRAKRVIALSQDEAMRFNHKYIGTEHLILGLVRDGGVAARVLASLGADLSQMRTAVGLIGRGDAATDPAQVALSPRALKVCEFAVDEARKRGHGHVGAEHLLLGVVREGEGMAAGILASLGIRLETIRAKVMETFTQAGPAVVPAVPAFAPSDLGSLARLEADTQRAIALAENEAIGLDQTWVGTEHLVLGLVTANGTIAQKALLSLGVTADDVRERVAKVPAPGAEWKARELRLTLLAEQLLERPPRHWRPMTTQGLLFAIVGEAESQGAQILAALGARAEKVREEINKLEPPH